MDKEVNLHYGDLYENDRYSLLRYNKYVRALKDKLLGEKVRLLEIGCYTAKLAELLPRNIDYVGVDFDEKAVKIARDKGLNVRKVNFDSEGLEFKEKFDIIVAAEIIEHLLDPDKMMKQIKGLIKDDGAVLISLPNENTIYHRLLSVLGMGTDLCVFQLYKHLHFPTIRQSIGFVSRYFKVVKKDYYINPGAKGSRVENLAIIFNLIPDSFWEFLANAIPGCFARGIIMLCEKPK